MQAEDLTHDTADRALVAEQVRLLYRHFTFMSLANISSVLVFAYILSTRLSWTYGVPWAGALICSIGLRVRLTRAFEKTDPDDTQIAFWAQQAVKSTFLSGLLWSMLPPLGTMLGLHTFLVVSFLVSLMATVFVAPGSTYRPAFFSFSVPIICSVAFSFIFLVPEYWYAGVAMLFGLAIMINLSKHYHRILVESIRIRFENRALIEQLTQQKLEAEEANRSKSRFLAAASHDLRQPLHALNLYFDALQIAPAGQRRRSLLEKIDVAVNTLNDLFDRLLDISRLDAGVVVPSMSECTLERIFHNLRVHFTPPASEKGLSLTLDHRNLRVQSDAVLLQQMLDNLVSNAIRYTEQGDIVVEAEQDGDTVCIRVRDSGCGIPEDEQQNIFNEFYQLANPERDRRQGLGLGLSIVKRLCTLTGHTIDLRSTPGAGTEFRLRLPAAQPGAAPLARDRGPSTVDDPPGRYAPSRQRTGAGRFPGLRVLVVDDDPDIRDAMQERLSEWGCHVAMVESIKQARRVVRGGFEPDIVLADYRLRDRQTGLQALQAVENLLGRPVRGILITGDTAGEPLNRAANSGYRLLHKPVRSEQLHDTISFMIGDRDRNR